MNRRVLLFSAGILVIATAITAFLLITSKPQLTGTVITPPLAAAEINLTNDNSQPFTMSSQRGKVVLLYFGYVNCPDECPLTMAHLKLALKQLGDRAKDAQVVMVSTDSVRDTPQAMKEFMGKFDPSFMGLPGSPEELQKVWNAYGVTVLDGGETHSNFIYVIDPKGNIRETFLSDSEPNDIASDVGLLLQGK